MSWLLMVATFKVSEKDVGFAPGQALKYQIEFSIYLKQFAQGRAERPIGYFGLSDYWTNSIDQKYQKRLLKTIREADEFHETQRSG